MPSTSRIPLREARGLPRIAEFPDLERRNRLRWGNRNEVREHEGFSPEAG